VIIAKKIAFTRSENRPMTSASTPDTSIRAIMPSEQMRSRSGPAVEREPDAVGADAEEHRVGEGDDAGVAEQQIVARHQHDEDQILAADVERLRAGNRNGASASATRPSPSSSA
jgi:hypothetical protein